MSAKYFTTLYEEFCLGNSLSNLDLVNLEAHFRELDQKLSMCGPVFRLAALEAARVARQCRDYMSARGLKQ